MPSGIALFRNYSLALIADYNNNMIRRLDLLTTDVTAMAGSYGASYLFLDEFGTNAAFDHPYGIAIDQTESFCLISEYYGCRIRKIIFSTTEVSTVAGGSNCGQVVNGFGM